MMMYVRKLFLGILLSTSMAVSTVHGESETVFSHTVDRPMSEIYPMMSRSFENSRFFVIKEINIGKSLAGFSGKWGEDYNRNGLTEIRSMVFCNGWYANQVSNLDPDMLGLCPLHLTLYEKNGHSTVLFNRPTAIAGGSPAYELLEDIEHDVIEIIKKAMR